MTDVYPLVLERYFNYASLFFRNTPTIAGYRVRVASSLNDAYGNVAGVGGAGTAALFDVARGQFYRSRSIRERGLGVLGECNRGITQAIYDPMDFFNPPTTTVVPHDRQIAFLRVQTMPVGGAFPAGVANQGPILILQSPEYAVVPRPALTLSGTAPTVATAAAGSIPPDGCMEFRVPMYGDSLIFINHDAASPILLSTGRDIPFMQIDPETQISHTSGMKDTYVIAAPAGNPDFSIMISSVQGAR